MLDVVDKSVVHTLHCGDVYLDIFNAVGLGLFNEAEHAVDDEIANLVNCTAFFGGGDKIGRRDKPDLVVSEADKRFCGDELVLLDAVNGLIVHLEAAVVYRFSDVAVDVKAKLDFLLLGQLVVDKRA